MLKHHFRRFWNFGYESDIREKDVKFKKIQIFKHNSIPNCFTIRNSYMRGLDLNTKKTFLAILEFSISRGEISRFRKNQIFKCYSAPSHICVTKFHMKRLVLNTNKQLFSILEFSILRGRKGGNL